MKSESIRPYSNFIFIDDDPLNNLICKMTVEVVLGKVPSHSFANPELGLEYLRSSFLTDHHTARTILLLDINMPVMSGWEFLEHFDNLPCEIKDIIHIYILSSSVDERDRERSYASKNVRDFLVKPLTKDTVIQMLTGYNSLVK